MRIFEPENAIAWIGFTLPEEKILANATLAYLSSVGWDSPFFETVVETRATGSILEAEKMADFFETIAKTSAGLPDIEWNDECEENSNPDGTRLALDRIWIWKKVWDSWTRDHLPEYPGNETLARMDKDAFETHEFEKALRYERRFWDAFKRHTEKGLAEDVAFDLAKDESPRGENVISSLLLQAWKDGEEDILAEMEV